MRSRKWQVLHSDRVEKLEKMVFAQHEKLDKLESLMYRVMHRDRMDLQDGPERMEGCPRFEDESPSDLNYQSPPSEFPAAGQDSQRVPKSDSTKPYYSISSA